jgi:nucleotide-binding universal stress UspA family protein
MDSTESPDPATAPIVVGVDGTPAGREALAFALHEGACRGTRVDVVTAWQFTGPYDEWIDTEQVRQAREHAERVQGTALTDALTRADVRPLVTHTVVEGAAGKVLVDAARDAAYLVVGSAHKSLARRTLLGSVSHYCVQHATVPVVVVPCPAAHPGPVDPAVAPSPSR